MRYFLSAGEVSGDLHASMLISALRDIDAEAQFTLLGGDAMAREASCHPLIHIRDMAWMGFSEVIRHLPQIGTNLKLARRALEEQRPDALILVDYPGFNMKLAQTAHKLGIPMFYYIPPKVWAWKEYRVKTMRRLGMEILSILPFERKFYERHGVDATYVGNPSVEEADKLRAEMPGRDEFFAKHDLTGRPIIAVVPGSRVGEIRNNLPVMDAAVRRYPDHQAVVAGAPGIDMQLYRSMTTLPVVSHDTFTLMTMARAAVVTSGTATLECALARTPQVACYRSNGSRLTYNLMKRILKVRYVTLPNLIADEPVIPELLLHHCTAAEIEHRLGPLLGETVERAEQLAGYRRMRDALGRKPAALTAAQRILTKLHER